MHPVRFDGVSEGPIVPPELIKLMCPKCDRDTYEALVSLEDGLPLVAIRCPECNHTTSVRG
jgi:hypothetical protein